MTKQEAISAMKEGKKVTHRNFTPDEWMCMAGSIMILEDGVKCHQNEFWRWRTNDSWKDGYSFYSES